MGCILNIMASIAEGNPGRQVQNVTMTKEEAAILVAHRVSIPQGTILR